VNELAFPPRAKGVDRCRPAISRSLAAAAVSFVAATAGAQTLGPDFAGLYSIIDLGPVPGVPSNYGGLLFAPGDPSVLLIGGAANSLSAAIYAVVVQRSGNGDVLGFGCGQASYFQAAPGVTGGIDGGLDAEPSGVAFYTTYPDNHIGQIKSSSVGPDRLIDLTPLGVSPSTGTLRFVPANFPGAGRLKIASYNTSRWYDATITPDGNGTFDVSVSPGFIQLGGGPEGIVYIKGSNPGFGVDSVLMSNYATGSVDAFEIDANGDPKPNTARTFITGLAGAEGAAIDPVTGDFIFSTFGGLGNVLRVTGFASTSTCIADLNLDGQVNGADLAQMLGAWGATSGSIADLNGNCVVDGSDLAVLLGNWGDCSP